MSTEDKDMVVKNKFTSSKLHGLGGVPIEENDNKVDTYVLGANLRSLGINTSKPIYQVDNYFMNKEIDEELKEPELFKLVPGSYN